MGFRHYFWTRGEPWRSVRSQGVPRVLQAVHSTLMSTLRVSTSGFSRGVPYLENTRGPHTSHINPENKGAIFVLWHDHTLMLLHVFRRQNIGVMMSTSRSGQIQAAFWRLYGWPTVWGSTKKREGIRALREVMQGLRDGQSFGFTPDGPKGPRHRAQPGVLFLATHTPAVVMPIAVAASSAWQLPTWDRYLIPKPFSRVHVHLGPPINLPPDIPREETARWQTRIEQAIDAATEEAERRVHAK